MSSRIRTDEARLKEIATASALHATGSQTTHRSPFSAMTVLYFMWAGYMTVYRKERYEAKKAGRA